jgi:hypothetical protein
MNQTYVDPNQLLRTHVPEYIPNTYTGYWAYNRMRPLFTQFTVREMLIDPRVIFGLWLIKGPILSKAKFSVESDNEDVREHVVDMINEFWLNGAVQALKAIEWGYSGNEVLYKIHEKTGRIVYNGLKDFEPPSVKVITKGGSRVGILVDDFQTVSMTPGKAVYLGGPKAFHHVHWRHLHPYYGRSRLVGSHIPWNEQWSEGGYRDIRRMWFYRNAFEGGTLYAPRGKVKTQEGVIKSYQDIAQEILDRKRTGQTMVLPNDVDQRSGQRKWEYKEPKGNTIPSGLFEYGESLRIEILEAMGIPYEVIEASGNEGFGSSSGREIPETAFYAILQEELNWLIYDFVEQVVRPSVQINSALGLMPYDTFKVLAYPIDSSPEEMEYEDDGMDQNQPNDGPPKKPDDSPSKPPQEKQMTNEFGVAAKEKRKLAVAA